MSFDYEAVKINLDSSAFEKEIKALYKNPAISELKVKAKLTASSVTALLKSFETVKATVKVNAVLQDLKTIQASLDALSSEVKVSALLDFTKAASQLEKYNPSKAVLIKTELDKAAFDLVKTEIKSFLKPVFKTINVVLNQEAYQTAYSSLVASLADTKKLPKTKEIKIAVDTSESSKIDDLVKSTPEDLDIPINLIGDKEVKAELLSILETLNAIAHDTHKAKVTVTKDSSELDKLEGQIKVLKQSLETVQVQVKVDPQSIATAKNQIDDLAQDRTVVLKTRIDDSQTESTELISEKLSDEAAHQVKKLFDKVNKGITRDENKVPLSAERYQEHASELNDILSILNKIDNVDLFNEAVLKITKVRDILAKMSGTSFDHAIPALKQQKKEPTSNAALDNKYQDTVIDIPVRAVLDEESLNAVINQIESKFKSLQAFISNHLQTGISAGLSEINASDRIPGLDIKINSIGLDGVSELLSSLKELKDFGVLEVNNQLDALIERADKVSAWVKSAQASNIEIAFSLGTLEDDSLKAKIAEIQTQLDKIPVYLALALAEDTKTLLNGAIAKLDLDVKNIDLGIDCQELHRKIDNCIENVEKDFVTLEIKLNSGQIKAQVTKVLEYLQKQKAQITLYLNNSEVLDQLAKVIQDVEASKALLPLALNDSKFQDELADLKAKIAEDFVNLQVKLQEVSTTELAQEIGEEIKTEVAQALKKISAEDLAAFEQKNQTAKGMVTKLGKPNKIEDASVINQRDGLVAIAKELADTDEEALLAKINDNIAKLNGILSDRHQASPSDGGLSGSSELPSKINGKTPLTREEKEAKARAIIAGLEEESKPRKKTQQAAGAAAYFANSGMDASEQIVELARGISKIVAKVKGLDDVWKDDMLPQIFAKGYPLQPAANGVAFNDNSGIVLAAGVAEGLENIESITKDSLVTLTHEITHIMQNLAESLGRTPKYETTPTNVAEKVAVLGVTRHPVYQAENEKDGGRTFEREIDSNLTPLRLLDQLVDGLGLTIADTLDPIAKQTRLQKNSVVAMQQSAAMFANFAASNPPERAKALFKQMSIAFADFIDSIGTDISHATLKQVVDYSSEDGLSAMAGSFELPSEDPWADNSLPGTIDELNAALLELQMKLKKLAVQTERGMTKEEKKDFRAEKDALAKQIDETQLAIDRSYASGNKSAHDMTTSHNIVETRKSPKEEQAAIDYIYAKIKLITTQIDALAQRTKDNSTKSAAQTASVNATTAGKNAKTAATVQKTANQDTLDKQNLAAKAALDSQRLIADNLYSQAKLAKENLKVQVEDLRKTKQTATNAAEVQKDIERLQALQTRNQTLLVKLGEAKVALHVASNSADSKIQKSVEALQGQILRNLTQEEKLIAAQLANQITRDKMAGNTPSPATQATPSSTTTTTTSAAVVNPSTSVSPNAQITQQMIDAEEAQLQALRDQAREAYEKASLMTNANVTTKEKQVADLDLQQKIYKVRQAEVDLANKKLLLSIKNATASDNIQKSRLELQQQGLAVEAAQVRLDTAKLNLTRKQQLIDAANLKAANAATKAAKKDTTARAYGASGGSKSQVNAERRLPINLGLNILEASNNRLGNLARVFIDLTEGIHGASLAGESFGQTLNRIKMPIAIIGTIGALATLTTITAPAALAVQKLEKSLAAFGRQDQFAGAFATSKELALDFGVSLQIASGELARFKTSLVDTSIESDADSIFSSLGKYGSIVGATQDELSRGYVALGQIASKGKVSLEELNGQLSEAIPGASSMAAKALGVTKKELYEMASAGSLLSDDFLPKFRDELEKVAVAQEAIGTETLAVAFARVKESLTLLGLEQTQKGLDILAGGFSKLADWLKAGLTDPADDASKKLLSFSSILNKAVIAGVVFLGNTLARFLLPKVAATAVHLNLLTVGLYRNARGLQTTSAASQMAVHNFRNLLTGIKAAVAGVAPMVAAFLLLDGAFKIFNQAKGDKFFDDFNANMQETADNIKKLKIQILEDLADIENGKPKPKGDPKNDFLKDINAPQVSQPRREQLAKEFDERSAIGRYTTGLGASTALTIDHFQKKVNYSDRAKDADASGNLTRAGILAQIIEQENYKISKSAKEATADLGETNAALGEYVNDAEAMAKLEGQVAERNKLNDTISGMGLLIKAFNEGSVSSSDLQANLAEMSVPKDLIPPELGSGLGGVSKEADDLNNILGNLKFRQSELNTEINKLSPETFKLQIDEATKKREELQKGTAAYEAQSKIILEATINLEKYNQIVGKQKVQLDLVNKSLISYNALKAEEDGRVDQAALLSRVLLKEEALNKGLIKRSSIENQLTRIEAKSHTEKMKGYREQRIALNALTKNVNKSDAFQAKNILKKPELFSKQKNGTFSFQVDRASIAELDLLLNSPVANFSDSFKKAIETAKTDMSGISTGYVTEQEALQDLEFSVREKAAEVEKDTSEALQNAQKALNKHTKDFVASFTDAIKAINEEVKGIEREIKAIKITNSGKQLHNALARLMLNADKPLDSNIVEAMNLRLQQGVDNSLADLEFESESERIATAFASGVDEIRKAFTDYLEEFRKLQEDLIKARIDRAKALKEKAEAEAALKGDDRFSPNLKVFGLSKTQLNQGIGKSIVDNPIPDSEARMKESQKLGEEAKKQTEQGYAQMANQERNNVLALSQIEATGTSSDSIVDAIQNSDYSTNVDFTGLDVFQSMLVVLMQIRDGIGMVGTIAEGQGYAPEESREVQRGRLASSELKDLYEQRDANIEKLNAAQNAFNADSSDLEAAKNFERAAEAIADSEIQIMNRQTELKQLGHEIDNPLTPENRTKIGTISADKHVVNNKYGTGVLSNIDRKATQAAMENAPIDQAKLAERQEKYNNKAGITKPELRKILSKTSYSEQELINLPRNEVEYIAQLLKMTLEPLEKMAVAPIFADGSEAQPSASGVPAQVAELAKQLNRQSGMAQYPEGAASSQPNGNWNNVIPTQENLTDSVDALAQVMSNPVIAGNSNLTALGKEREQSERNKAKASGEKNKLNRQTRTIESEGVDIQIEEKKKALTKIPGLDAIAEALKPKGDAILEKAKLDTKDKATRLDSLKEAVKPAEELLKSRKAELVTLEASLKATNDLKLQAVIQEQIAAAKTAIADIDGNDQIQAARSAIALEQKRYDLLVKNEETILRIADAYNKQVKTAGLKGRQNKIKGILEDPNISPEDEVKGKRQEKRLEQQITFGDRKAALIREKLAGNPAATLADITKAAQEAEQELIKIDKTEMNNLESSLDTVVNKLKGSFKDAIGGIFSIDFADTSKRFSEKLFDVFNGVLKNLQSWAADKLGQVLDSWINAGSSDGAGKTLNAPKGGGTQAALTGVASLAASSLGGGYGALASSVISAFMADGGEVGKGYGTESAIAQMMAKERIMSNGKTPVLAALHQGEHVLSTKNKDSQAFRSFQQSGVWDALKDSAGFASGGSVGRSFPAQSMLMNKTSNSQTKNITSINNFNFTATNDKLINRTEKQIKNRKDQFLD